MHKHGGDIYENPGMLDFSANLNPMGMPDGIKEALRAGVDQMSAYPDPDCRELAGLLSAAENIDKRHLILGNGAADLIFSIVLAGKPKQALLCAPCFAEYEQALRAVGTGISYHELDREQGFQLTERILPKLTEQIDILFLCNPNNPTGCLTSRELLVRILRECERKDILLVIDECFLDFTGKEEEYTLKGLIAESRHLVILKAFTKMYAMAGLRLGYGFVGDTGLIRKMTEVTQPWNVSVPAQIAGIAALQETEFTKKSVRLVQQERIYLIEELKKRGLTVFESSVNYVFFYYIGNSSGLDLTKAFLAEQILIRDCSNYVGLEKGYYRIAVRLPEENKHFIEVLDRVLAGEEQEY